MRTVIKNMPFVLAIAWGFVILVPFVILEVVNRWQYRETFPYELFTFAWALQTVFVYLFMSKPTSRMGSFLRIIGLVAIAYIWGGWVVDQWPCLMGVPNCD